MKLRKNCYDGMNVALQAKDRCKMRDKPGNRYWHRILFKSE